MIFLTCIAIFIATFGYSLINNIPKKHLFFSALNGCMGYAVYMFFLPYEVLGCFMGACVIAAFGEIFSRTLKDAATLFILSGIIPLVPGAKMYQMTLALLHQDFRTAADYCIQVILFAGSIALAIILVSSTVRSISRYVANLKVSKPHK